MQSVQVHSGAAALERLRREHFDAMTLDVLMPGMNGFDVLEAVRADAKPARPAGDLRLGLLDAVAARRRVGRHEADRPPAPDGRPELRDPGEALARARRRAAVRCAPRSRRRSPASASSIAGRTARSGAARAGAEQLFEVALVHASMSDSLTLLEGAALRGRRGGRSLILFSTGDDAQGSGERRGHAGVPPAAGDQRAARDARERDGRPRGKMTGVSTDQELRSRIDELEAELARRADEAQDKELQLQRYAADLRETFIEERTRSEELHRSYMLTVRALASAVEARDAYTGKHAERVAAYGLALAEVYGLRLGDEPQIEFGFLLHDVGKVAVPDAILFKPGPLTEAERIVMQQHPVTGSEIVREIEFLGAAREVIRSHHERWDGSGYPDAPRGRRDPGRGAGVRGRRHARRADDAPPLPRALDARRGAPDHRRTATASHFDPEVVVAFRALPDATIDAIRERIG